MLYALIYKVNHEWNMKTFWSLLLSISKCNCCKFQHVIVIVLDVIVQIFHLKSCSEKFIYIRKKRTPMVSSPFSTPRPATLLKEESYRRYFSVNFAKFWNIYKQLQTSIIYHHLIAYSGYGLAEVRKQLQLTSWELKNKNVKSVIIWEIRRHFFQLKLNLIHFYENNICRKA